MIIDTAEKWWSLLDDYKDDLLNLVASFHSAYRHQHWDTITASLAEKVAEAVRGEIYDKQFNEFGEQVKLDPQRLFEQYLKSKDCKMADLLNEVWWGMPESMESRGRDGFGVLCDLCSEAYVLFEGEQNVDDC
jgi:hypothetical protein